MILAMPVLDASDLATITGDVWAAFLTDVQQQPGTDPTPPDGPLHAEVTIAGAWTGRIALGLSAAGADLVARTMLGAAQVEPDDVADAVGELANMVGGNVKSMVPAPSSLGLPQVRDGLPAARPDDVEVCRTSLTWSGHQVHVVVWSSPAG